MYKTVMITGVTSGFGKALAEKFAANENNVIITGRRAERLATLKEDLQTKYKTEVLTLEFDVRDKEKTYQIFEQLPASWQHIDVLINNAGLALGRDYFEEADMEDW